MNKLGTVDQNGVCRFAGDINDCRAFLRGLGLECPTSGPIWGWNKPGWQGAIYYDNGYHAAAWRKGDR